MKNTKSRGFSLIELMVTVAILAILASIALPSYSSYVRKGKRATAQAALMDIASKQQAYLLDRRAYTTDLNALGFVAPPEISGAYTFSVVVTAAPTFTASATATGSQASGGEVSPISITNLGVKSPANTPGYWGK